MTYSASRRHHRPALQAYLPPTTTRRLLVTYPQDLAAVLHTARTLRRSPDRVSVRNVAAFRGSNSRGALRCG
jgi:hypothetical protein